MKRTSKKVLEAKEGEAWLGLFKSISIALQIFENGLP